MTAEEELEDMEEDEEEVEVYETESVRDKSNLKIGHENYPKTVRFFDRDLSTGHVTSFSM